jgi:hypothetical protein
MTTGAAARSHVLQTAERLVNNERNTQYDEPSADFARTAAMWTAYFGIPVAMHDVAAAIAMLKLSRIRHNPEHVDNWIDLAGYAACGADVADAVNLEDAEPATVIRWHDPSDPLEIVPQPGHGDDCAVCVANAKYEGGYRWQERPEGAR